MNVNPILIFGVDRSGTSAVANMVDKWGAYGGQTLETRGDSRNPKGYYENLSLQTIINDHLDDFFRLNYRCFLEEKAKSGNAKRDFNEFVQEMESAGKIWFMKEPLIGLMLPFFRQFLNNPVCLITLRNPYESALSWQKFTLPKNSTHNIISANLLRWQYIITETLRNVRGLRKIFISYEQLHANPNIIAANLANFLDRCYGTTSSKNTLNVMASMIDNDLYRNKSQLCFEEFDGASEKQKELYRTLTKLAENPDHPVKLDYPLPLGWNEYVGNAINLSELEHDLNNKSLNPIKFFSNFVHPFMYWLLTKSSFSRGLFERLNSLKGKDADLERPKYDLK